ALYGFPESHAASFALIAYASAYLKHHHPAAFFAAMLNCYPLGFYHPSTLVKDAQRHGVVALPVDVTRSNWKCSMEGIDVPVPGRRSFLTHPEGSEATTDPGLFFEDRRLSPAYLTPDSLPEGKRRIFALRMGLRYVSGLREEIGLRIEAERSR